MPHGLRPVVLVFLFLLLVTGFTHPAYADGIDLPLFLAWGIGIIVPILAFNIFGEALVLRLVLAVPFGAASKFFLRANLWSLAGGIPTKILNAFLFAWLMPDDLSAFYHRYPLIAVVCILTYFVVTCLIEIWVGSGWYPKADRSFSRKSLFLTILAANVLTYSVLGPLYYWTTRPMWSDVDDITPDSSWARNTEARIFYVDSDTHDLMTIHADGSGRETWVPLPMMEYLLSGDLNFCVFLGEDGDFHYYDRSMDRHVGLGPAGEDPAMGRVALSPSGKRVAVWRSPTTDCTLCVYDMITGATQTRTLDKDEYASWRWVLAWSVDEDRLYARSDNLTEIRLYDKYSLVRSVSATESLCPCYGRFGYATLKVGDEQVVLNYSDSCHDKSLEVEHGLGSGIMVFLKDSQSHIEGFRPDIVLAINPGILHFPSWQVFSASFLPGCEETVFEDFNSIYLWDMTQRKIGKVTRGERHLVLTKAYRKERIFGKENF